MSPADDLLPERIEGDGVLLRRWRVADAEALGRAAQTLAQRRAMLAEREREWRAGGDVMLGIFLAGAVAGSCGLHRRLGPSGLEIGYWLHSSFTGRGLATTVARLLTRAAFSLPATTHVEVHTDKANSASAGVPRRLGFRLVAETPDEPKAPAEVGNECVWRIDRAAWEHRSLDA